jgi:hypothetical protein
MVMTGEVANIEGGRLYNTVSSDNAGAPGALEGRYKGTSSKEDANRSTRVLRKSKDRAPIYEPHLLGLLPTPDIASLF